ncbi:unnamed protein product [Calicophoron daubneyi]|uniref:Uncharacterized protein n=1 Tax=Calicophoron daubneyi TaxID=300641 RepID=A0AAV2TB46_CALDB
MYHEQPVCGPEKILNSSRNKQSPRIGKSNAGKPHPICYASQTNKDSNENQTHISTNQPVKKADVIKGQFSSERKINLTNKQKQGSVTQKSKMRPTQNCAESTLNPSRDSLNRQSQNAEKRKRVQNPRHREKRKRQNESNSLRKLTAPQPSDIQANKEVPKPSVTISPKELNHSKKVLTSSQTLGKTNNSNSSTLGFYTTSEQPPKLQSQLTLPSSFVHVQRYISQGHTCVDNVNKRALSSAPTVGDNFEQPKRYVTELRLNLKKGRARRIVQNWKTAVFERDSLSDDDSSVAVDEEQSHVHAVLCRAACGSTSSDDDEEEEDGEELKSKSYVNSRTPVSQAPKEDETSGLIVPSNSRQDEKPQVVLDSTKGQAFHKSSESANMPADQFRERLGRLAGQDNSHSCSDYEEFERNGNEVHNDPQSSSTSNSQEHNAQDPTNGSLTCQGDKVPETDWIPPETCEINKLIDEIPLPNFQSILNSTRKDLAYDDVSVTSAATCLRSPLAEEHSIQTAAGQFSSSTVVLPSGGKISRGTQSEQVEKVKVLRDMEIQTGPIESQGDVVPNHGESTQKTPKQQTCVCQTNRPFHASRLPIPTSRNRNVPFETCLRNTCPVIRPSHSEDPLFFDAESQTSASPSSFVVLTKENMSPIGAYGNIEATKTDHVDSQAGDHIIQGSEWSLGPYHGYPDLCYYRNNASERTGGRTIYRVVRETVSNRRAPPAPNTARPNSNTIPVRKQDLGSTVVDSLNNTQKYLSREKGDVLESGPRSKIESRTPLAMPQPSLVQDNQKVSLVPTAKTAYAKSQSKLLDGDKGEANKNLNSTTMFLPQEDVVLVDETCTPCSHSTAIGCCAQVVYSTPLASPLLTNRKQATQCECQENSIDEGELDGVETTGTLTKYYTYTQPNPGTPTILVCDSLKNTYPTTDQDQQIQVTSLQPKTEQPSFDTTYGEACTCCYSKPCQSSYHRSHSFFDESSSSCSCSTDSASSRTTSTSYLNTITRVHVRRSENRPMTEDSKPFESPMQHGQEINPKLRRSNSPGSQMKDIRPEFTNTSHFPSRMQITDQSDSRAEKQSVTRESTAGKFTYQSNRRSPHRPSAPRAYSKSPQKPVVPSAKAAPPLPLSRNINKAPMRMEPRIERLISENKLQKNPHWIEGNRRIQNTERLKLLQQARPKIEPQPLQRQIPEQKQAPLIQNQQQSQQPYVKGSERNKVTSTNIDALINMVSQKDKRSILQRWLMEQVAYSAKRNQMEVQQKRKQEHPTSENTATHVVSTTGTTKESETTCSCTKCKDSSNRGREGQMFSGDTNRTTSPSATSSSATTPTCKSMRRRPTSSSSTVKGSCESKTTSSLSSSGRDQKIVGTRKGSHAGHETLSRTVDNTHTTDRQTRSTSTCSTCRNIAQKLHQEVDSSVGRKRNSLSVDRRSMDSQRMSNAANALGFVMNRKNNKSARNLGTFSSQQNPPRNPLYDDGDCPRRSDLSKSQPNRTGVAFNAVSATRGKGDHIPQKMNNKSITPSYCTRLRGKSEVRTEKINELSKFGSKMIPPNNFEVERVFELSQYDDLVKSHLSVADRRIKAVATKNGCNIKIVGPISTSEPQMPGSASRCRISFHCHISGPSEDRIGKCVNFLKETFPNSFLRTSWRA